MRKLHTITFYIRIAPRSFQHTFVGNAMHFLLIEAKFFKIGIYFIKTCFFKYDLNFK